MEMRSIFEWRYWRNSPVEGIERDRSRLRDYKLPTPLRSDGAQFRCGRL